MLPANVFKPQKVLPEIAVGCLSPWNVQVLPRHLGRRQREGEQPAMRRYGGIPSASLLSQRFWAARLLQEADGQQGLQRCQRKSVGRYQARESLARAKPVSGAGGMGAGKA